MDNFEDEYRKLLDEELPPFDEASANRAVTKTRGWVAKFTLGKCLVFYGVCVAMGLIFAVIQQPGPATLSFVAAPIPATVWFVSARKNEHAAIVVLFLGVILGAALAGFATS